MKSNMKMHIKIFGVIGLNLSTDNIQKTPHSLINQTKKVIGKFKDGISGIPINEFIGLRSKMYSDLKDTDEYGKTAKGIKKNVIRKILNMRIIKTFYSTINKHRYEVKDQQLCSYEINKISLSCFDDKRYLHDNGIYSYAYGHYEI